MSDAPIKNDVLYIDQMIQNAYTSYDVLSSNAQKSFDLRDSLLSNAQYTYSLAWINTLIAAHADWVKGTYNYTPIIVKGLYFGDKNSFFGNLTNGSVSGLLNNSQLPAGWVSSIAVNTTFNLSAGLFYNAASPKITLTVPTTTMRGDSVIFHSRRFAFISQYLWANPNDQYSQTQKISGYDFSIRNGVNYTGQSLLNSASTMYADTQNFYVNKKLYLSSLV